jgi:hypothetical protein
VRRYYCVLGAVAQFERDVLRERTVADIAAVAIARYSVAGSDRLLDSVAFRFRAVKLD